MARSIIGKQTKSRGTWGRKPVTQVQDDKKKNINRQKTKAELKDWRDYR